VKVEWFPYELNPDMPEEGIDRILYRQQKFGLERSAQFDAQLTQLGQDEGVPFASSAPLRPRTPGVRTCSSPMRAGSGAAMPSWTVSSWPISRKVGTSAPTRFWAMSR
jgi:hypothetical protein